MGELEKSVENQLAGTKEVNNAMSSINHVIQDAAATTDLVARETAGFHKDSDRLTYIVQKLNEFMGNKESSGVAPIDSVVTPNLEAPRLREMSFS